MKIFIREVREGARKIEELKDWALRDLKRQGPRRLSAKVREGTRRKAWGHKAVPAAEDPLARRRSPHYPFGAHAAVFFSDCVLCHLAVSKSLAKASQVPCGTISSDRE